MGIDSVVNITITRQAVAVAQQNFGRCLILGSAGPTTKTDLFWIYTSLADMVAAGFSTASPEYAAATAMMSQPAHPVDFMVGYYASGDPDDAIDAILAKTGGDQWYTLILCSRTKADIENAAAHIETLGRDFYACTADADVFGNVAGNVAATIKATGAVRTCILYSADAAHFPEASLAALIRTKNPGAAPLQYRTLPGVTADVLSPTQQSNLTTNNVISYIPMLNLYLTFGAKAIGGEWMDVIEGIDALKSDMQTGVFNALVGTDTKVPYTDAGIATVEAPVRASLLRFSDAQHNLLSAFAITVPKAADITQADKTNRVLNGMDFDGTLAGAILSATITGRVHV